jgi:hypothetical protein
MEVLRGTFDYFINGTRVVEEKGGFSELADILAA